MDFRPRADVDRTIGLTLAGDLLCIGLFVALGALRHPGSTPLYVRVPETAAPFVVGWLLVGAFLGAFTAESLADTRTAALRAGIAWLGADLLAQAARATPFVSGGVALAFVVVSLVTGGAFLVGWRAFVARTFAS